MGITIYTNFGLVYIYVVMKHLQLIILVCCLALSCFAQSVESSEEVYTIVQEMPRFPGCEDMAGSVDDKKRCAEKKMLEYIYRNVEYPSAFKYACNFESLTAVSFIVEKDGCLNGLEVLRGHPAIANAFLKIVSEMPVWIPGKHHGQAVAVRYNIPFRIRLEE